LLLFGKIKGFIKILRYNNKCSNLDNIEKFYICRETAINKQINDRHSERSTTLVDAVIESESHMTKVVRTHQPSSLQRTQLAQ
jgi:hypothetical protein